jgi:hypothetical protein
MDGVVQHLRCRYLVAGDRAPAGVRARLDEVARQAVERAWDGALDRALAHDPSVYVLRRVTASYHWDPDRPAGARLAEAWGDSLAAAVTRTIAADPSDGSNLVRFDDQIDYLAHFVVDLVDGAAWSRWFYGPFTRLRTRTTADALTEVLLEDRDRLAGILTRLRRLGSLDKVLGRLDDATRRAVWAVLLGAPPPADRDAARVLLAAAAELAAAVGLGAGRPDAALLERYLRTGPAPVRWGEPSELAHGTFEAFRWLVGGRRAGPPAGEWQPRLEAALARLDWLDTSWLHRRLLGFLDEPDPVPLGLPASRRPRPPTPRQRELVEALAALVRFGAVPLDPGEPASAGNCLRLQAAMLERTPALADDAALPELIQRLLRLWSWVRASPSPAEALRWLEAGDPDRTLRALAPDPGGPVASRPAAPAAAIDAGVAAGPDPETVGFAAGLGAVASDLVGALDGGAGGLGGDPGVDSPAAGVLLLLRVLAGVRVAGLAARAGYPPAADDPAAVLPLAVGLRWAGAAGVAAGRVDPAVALLGGLDTPPALAALGRACSAVTPAEEQRFQLALLDLLAGRGLLTGDGLHLFALAGPGRATTVVASSDPSRLWPVGTVVTDLDRLPATVAGWLAAWQDLGRRRPAWLLCDQPLAGPLCAALPGDQVTGVAVQGRPGPDAAVTAHREGRRALVAARRSLRRGRLGLPGPDLTAELTAAALLRLWARWLQGFAGASVPYLLHQLVRRPGRLRPDRDGHGLLVELDPRPLDVVLELAGYLAPLAGPGFDGVPVGFRIRGT